MSNKSYSIKQLVIFSFVAFNLFIDHCFKYGIQNIRNFAFLRQNCLKLRCRMFTLFVLDIFVDALCTRLTGAHRQDYRGRACDSVTARKYAGS